MPESESFDAFYARTVWTVTSQMHALADEDSLADHAIREAYARAYQQWYEVARYPDSEAWVLGVAKDAYQRRRSEAGDLRDDAPAPGHDPLSWPGMFRPAPPKAQALADPEATLAPRPGAPAAPGVPAGPGPQAGGPGLAGADALASDSELAGGPAPGGGPALAGGDALVGPAAGVQPAAAAAGEPGQTAVPPGGLFGSPAPGSIASGATADWAGPPGAAHGGPIFSGATYGDAPTGDATPSWGAPAGSLPTARIGARATSGRSRTGPSGRPLGGLIPAALASRRNLIAAATAAAIVVAGVIVYAVGGGHSSGHGGTAGVSAKAVVKPTVHMLPAGRTGNRTAIPWSLIGPGWTLAEVSTAQPDANGAPTGGGRYVTYLVDPEGGKYRILTTSGSAAPDLLAWSGNARTALYAVGGAQGGGAPGYGLLTLASGQLTSLPLPAGVTALGFTRPDGFNILAVRQEQGKYRLERYNLAGARQATIGSLPRPAGASDVLQGNALSSPDGTTAVWGVSGHAMQLVSNAGGLIRRLRVPGAGTSPSCTPISWWSSQTVLAYCNAGGAPDAGRLWLVPAGGGQATQLTGISGSPSGAGDLTGAWQAGGAVYITATTSAQCTSAASGPGGQQILQLSQGGAEAPVSIPGSTNHHATVVTGVGKRLLVLAQTSCPGTSSLIWFNPSTHATQTVLTAPVTEVGVVDAVPYGSGPAAATNGLS
jgi:hypothetical protein